MAITYDSGSNTITVAGDNGGNGYTMADVYAADVAGSWGVVTEIIANQAYYVNAHLAIGDGSTVSFLKSIQELVCFEPDKWFYLNNKGKLQLGDRYPASGDDFWGYRGSCWVMSATSGTVLTFIDEYFSEAEFHTYGSTLLLNGNLGIQLYDGKWVARNIKLVGNYYAVGGGTNGNSKILLKADMTVDWKRVQYSNFLLVSVYSQNILNFSEVHSHRCFYGISAMYMSVEIPNIRITDADTDVRYNPGASPRTLRIINPSEPLSTIILDQDYGSIEEAYTCNINVRDKDGDALSGVDVVCRDQFNNVVFGGGSPVTTDSNGDIAEQTIVNRDWTTKSEIETDYGPFTFTFSKDGYQTLTLENVTLDGPINWTLEMPSPTGGKAINLGMQT